MAHYLRTGQERCYDAEGAVVACAATGQDGELRPGEPWPCPRFEVLGESVRDRATGLIWSRTANCAGWPLTGDETGAWLAGLNRDEFGGHRDWRLPNRRELLSLVSHQEREPALPAGHPFTGVFLGWYWSGTPTARHPGQSWALQITGGGIIPFVVIQVIAVLLVALFPGIVSTLPALAQR
ncbi:MAG: DUF1566 domain-containing protein [Candidatus Krumholzibacteriia bacterium]